MLSLVAYQSSDENESDTEETSNSKTVQGESSKNSNSVKKSNSSLSSAVPAKTKETVKITVPSLKEFEDDEKDEPSSKKLKKSKGSGLISMLPPPKYSKPATSQKSFMPYVLTKKQVPSSNFVTNSVHKTNSMKPSEKPTASKPLVKTECHFKTEPTVVEKDDQTPVTDFFSLQEPKCSFSTPLSNNLESLKQSSQVATDFHQSNSHTEASSISPENSNITCWSDQPNTTHVQYAESALSSQGHCVGPYSENESMISDSYAGYPEINSDTTGHATDERFLKLQGRKRKGQEEEISFIDVCVDDQLSDKTQWLTKSITQEPVHRPSRKKHDMPTQLQKRKHQITYLAFQAKERELELKNQWSQNRLTKRETQAKYGF